ncbi:MAG: prenyltransferase [Pseudomonadota bacterium]
MKKILAGLFSKRQLQKTLDSLRAELEADRREQAWDIAQSLLQVQGHQREVAQALLDLVTEGAFTIEQVLEILKAIFAAHAQDFMLLALVGDATEYARDVDYLNLAPSEDPFFDAVLAALLEAVEKTHDAALEYRLWSGLFTCVRVMARQHDGVADRAGRRLVELEPDSSFSHYSYGLLLKTRGRFAEGMAENQLAEKLAEEPTDAMYWNAGICATGAGASDIALEIWKRLGNKIEMGRFGLPDGGYARCKVRLAQRPLAERNKNNDDPGLEETIWIDRLSPCHGIIRSVLYQDMGVDYGDVVLMDGAPITYHTYGDRQVPVFPHLATLMRCNYQFYDFAGTQDEEGKLAGATEDLGLDAIAYSHSENFQVLCASCWRDERLDHSHGTEQETHYVVRGRIAAPPDISPADLLQQLDAAMSKREPCRIYSPDLCEAVGLSDRAAVERRRYDMLAANT